MQHERLVGDECYQPYAMKPSLIFCVESFDRPDYLRVIKIWIKETGEQFHASPDIYSENSASTRNERNDRARDTNEWRRRPYLLL